MAIQHIELEDKYLGVFTQLNTERKEHNELKELIRKHSELQSQFISLARK